MILKYHADIANDTLNHFYNFTSGLSSAGIKASALDVATYTMEWLQEHQKKPFFQI